MAGDGFVDKAFHNWSTIAIYAGNGCHKASALTFVVIDRILGAGRDKIADGTPNPKVSANGMPLKMAGLMAKFEGDGDVTVGDVET
jgi:hypothetical protein